MGYARCKHCKTDYYLENNAILEKCYLCGETSFLTDEDEELWHSLNRCLPSFIHVHDEGLLGEIYNLSFPVYESAGEYFQKELKTRLNDENIEFLDVTYRIKKLKSYLNKIKRKCYSHPIMDMTDFCGIRIICFYLSDLNKISQLIEDMFHVIEFPKELFELKHPDQFSYRSMHFIVSPKEEGSFSDQYSSRGLRFEIQVRTVLMHAWADISHELIYKNEPSVSSKLKHDLNRLSATLELVDEQFEQLRKEKEEYIRSYFLDENTFNVDLDMNITNLIAFLDFNFPDKLQSIESSSLLLNMILSYNEDKDIQINFKNLLENIEKYKKLAEDDYDESYPMTQSYILRSIIDKSDFYPCTIGFMGAK